jgi:hypothetical protein
MRRGFNLVWSGWQGDVPPGADRLKARFPTSPRHRYGARGVHRRSNCGLLGDSNFQELSEERFVGTPIYPVANRVS